MYMDFTTQLAVAMTVEFSAIFIVTPGQFALSWGSFVSILIPLVFSLHPNGPPRLRHWIHLRPHLYEGTDCSEERNVKRQSSNSRSVSLLVYCGIQDPNPPGSFGASMAGLASIRAYGMQETFILEQMERTNKYTRIARSFHNLNRWISVRLQFISELFAVGLASYLFYSGTYSPGNIGFILEMAGKSRGRSCDII
jgi:hypothetical protein